MTVGRSARTSAEAITQADSDQRDAQVARVSVEAITQADSDQRDAQVARVSVEVITKSTSTVSVDHTFDAIAKAVGTERDHTFDAIAQTVDVEKDHTFDAIAKAVVAVDHTFDAITFGASILDHTFDAIAQAVDVEVDHTFDAITALPTVELDHTFDAIAQAVDVEKDHTFDAIAKAIGTEADHTFDAIAKAADNQLDHTFDAITAFPVASLDHTFDARVTRGWELLKTYTRTGTDENPVGFFGLSWGKWADLHWVEEVGSNLKYFWDAPGDEPQDLWGKNTDYGMVYNPQAADDIFEATGSDWDTWGASALNLELSWGSFESVFIDSTGDLHKFSFRGDQRTIGHQFLDSADIGDSTTAFAWTTWEVDHQTWSTTAQYIAAFDMVQDGDTVHLVTLEVNHDGSSADVFRYYYYKGNLTTQTWSVSAETVNTISQPSGQAGMPRLTNAIDWPRIALRSDDYIAVLHVGTPTIRTGTTYDVNLAVSVRNTSGTWTLYDGWRTAGNYTVWTNPADLVYGASDRLHVYWDEYDWTNTNYRKMHQSMTTAGTKDTADNYTTLSSTPHSIQRGHAQAYDASGWKCQYYYEQDSSGRKHVYVVEHVSEANPTISADTRINTDDSPDYTSEIEDFDDNGLWQVTRIGGYNYLIGWVDDNASGYYSQWWAVWMQSTHAGSWSAPIVVLRNNKAAADGGDLEGTDDQYAWPVVSTGARMFGVGAWTRSSTDYIWISFSNSWYGHHNLYQFEAPQIPSIEIDHTFDAVAKAVGTQVDHTFDAVLSSTTEFALDHTFDAIALKESALDHTFDANTIFVREIDHTFDAVLLKTHTIAANMDITINALTAADTEKSQIIGTGVVGPGAGGTTGPDQGRAPFAMKIYRPARRIIREDKDV